jgi:uncharacterized protein (TIGR04255 family)
MAQPRGHLGNAPIVEAVIDFRVLREPTVSAQTFAGLVPSLGGKYSQVDSIHSFETRFGIDRGKILDPSQVMGHLGWSYRAGTDIAQFRVDGFTFSEIEKYTNWEEVFSEAFRLWEIYIRLAKPKQLTRIAVRYINRMRISGSRNVGDFLAAPPFLPRPVSPLIQDFLTRLDIVDERRGSAARVVQALEPQIDPNTMSLLLDIDAYHEEALAPTDPSIPELFQRLRELKNEIFYASITDKTVEMYE